MSSIVDHRINNHYGNSITADSTPTPDARDSVIKTLKQANDVLKRKNEELYMIIRNMERRSKEEEATKEAFMTATSMLEETKTKAEEAKARSRALETEVCNVVQKLMHLEAFTSNAFVTIGSLMRTGNVRGSVLVGRNPFTEMTCYEKAVELRTENTAAQAALTTAKEEMRLRALGVHHRHRDDDDDVNSGRNVGAETITNTIIPPSTTDSDARRFSPSFGMTVGQAVHDGDEEERNPLVRRVLINSRDAGAWKDLADSLTEDGALVSVGGRIFTKQQCIAEGRLRQRPTPTAINHYPLC